MVNRTSNHEYSIPEAGYEKWHVELNRNFTALDAGVPIKDLEANRSEYTAKPRASFIATDTGAVYDATETGWTKATRAYARTSSEGQTPAWRVYNDGSEWVTNGPTAADTFSNPKPGPVLQHAANHAGTVHLRDTISSDDPLQQTVTFDGTSLIGPGVRGEASVYIDTDAADPGFEFLGGGRLEKLWLRGDPETVSGSFGTGTLLWLQDMGRGSVVEDVTIFGTTGHGMVVAGCQQMTFRHITVSRCGRVQDDTWSIYLTNSPTDGLETNANNWYDLQSHGGAPQGGLIAMRADQHPESDHPRTQHFYGLNVENGPQAAGVPLIEVAGRDHLFSGGRLVGLDAVDNVFKAVAGNRARNIRIKDLVCIAKTGNNTTFYYSNGVGTASPSIADCEIQTDGIGIHLDFYNQTRS